VSQTYLPAVVRGRQSFDVLADCLGANPPYGLKEALDEGWTVVQIYRVLQAEGRVKFSYQSFRLYVNSLILNPGQTRRQTKRDKPATPQAEKPEPAATQAADKAKGLVWNPNCNKEDLI